MRPWIQKGQDWLVTTGADLAASILAFIVVLIVGKIVIGAVRTVLESTLSKTVFFVVSGALVLKITARGANGPTSPSH